MKPVKTLRLMGLSSGILLSFAASTNSVAADLAWQVTPFAGYSGSMSFDSNEIPDLKSQEGGNWGLMVHKETNDPGILGVLFSNQKTDLSPDGYGDLTIQYLHISGALVSPNTPLRPYIGAGAGLTRLSAYDSTIKPSMSLAVGIQPRLTNNFAITAELRGYGTFFNSSSQFICDPSVCKARVESNIMGQLQANVGMTFRF